MKRLFALLLILALLATAGCAYVHPKEELSLTEGSNTHSDHEQIEIRIAGITRDEQGTCLEIEWISHSKEEAIFGASYTIERLEGKQWVSCLKAEDAAFDALAYVLLPGQTRKEVYRPDGLFDLSKPGTYRFRSECSAEGQDRCQVWAEFSVGKQAAQQTVGPLAFNARYIRSHTYLENVRFPHVLVIKSTEELDEAMKLGSGIEDGSADPKTLYDEAFFASKYLIVVALQASSGSARYEVSSVNRQEDGSVRVCVDVQMPQIGTCDMALWYILLELDRSDMVASEQNVQVQLGDRLEWGEPVQKLPIIQTNEIYRKPPALTLYYGTGSMLLDFAGCNWYFRQEDGTVSAPIGDRVDMPMLQNSLEALWVDAESAKLSFALEPDELSFTCWPYEDWVKGQADSHTVNAFENSFALRPGGWVYGIRATWNDNGRGYYGTAEYYIYIEGAKVSNHPLARES